MSFPSFVVLALRDVLGIPSTKIPIDLSTLLSYVLPPSVCYLVEAVLVVTPQTRTIRVALCPLVAFLALRAVLSVDMSHSNAQLTFLNVLLVFFLITMTARTFDWALTKEPLVRHLRPPNSSPMAFADAFDLVSNVRGHGWGWSRYQSYIPPETRPANHTPFVFCTFLSAVVHCLMCGALHRVIVVLAPVGIGPIPGGSTIFDDTLPLPVRCLKASIISILTGFALYAVLQMHYDLCTIPGLLILGQDPVQWPPLFNTPWGATSLNEFWGRRWHQLWRHTFLVLGGRPLSLILGRAGTVIGTFLASGVLHHIGLATINNQADATWMLVGFGMMAPGVLIERGFYWWTGERVGGVAGYIWTMAWLLLWGIVIVEGFARGGMYGCAPFADSVLPVQIPVAHFADHLDAWLHSM